MSPRTPIGHDLLERLGSLEVVDAPAQAIAKFIRNLKAPAKINEALSGTWLGHPVHPLLIVLPMGSWISAVMLDWLPGDSDTAADVLLGTGLVTAVPTVATGYADWADTEPASDTVRRIGIVHAACNGTAAGLFAASLAARAGGARGQGKLLALAGLGAIGAGGYLGGHLTYAEGVGVDTTTFEDYPEDWTQALADAAVGEGEMKSVDLDGVEILVARRGGKLYALANTCVHRGGSLADGELVGDCVKCPLHGSVFQLADGSVEQGPAAYPQPALETRVRDGSIEVRAAEA
jgi:nitrite reductase/ring-hydroxylating ferredoxin subunit